MHNVIVVVSIYYKKIMIILFIISIYSSSYSYSFYLYSSFCVLDLDFLVAYVLHSIVSSAQQSKAVRGGKENERENATENVHTVLYVVFLVVLKR